MALSDTKTLTSERNAAYVKSNPGQRLTGTVEENKNAFDKFPQLNMDKHNALVDLLITLGIDSIVDDLDSRYTKTETDTKISTETNNLIETIGFTADDGKFKITTKGGKETVIDTVLEKVPASFELVTESGKQYLKVTNQDGTSSQTDVTALFNVYRFEDSDTIDFTESPTYTVTAIVKNNSITLDHLSLAAVSTIEGYVSAAAGSATAAAGSATEAETSANNASTFAQSAKGYSESSASSKNAAEASATAAANAAQTANSKANAANSSAITAQSYAVGGTGSRQGEDTDNAKYYYQMAKEASGKDFVTQSELTTALSGKVDKETGKDLSTNDYNNTDKGKVDNLPTDTNVELNKKANKPTTITGTLAIGSTSIILTSPAITENSTVSVFTSKYDVSPINVVAETGKVTLTFEVQTEVISVKVEVATSGVYGGSAFIQGELAAGESTLTLNDSSITANSIVNVYTDKYPVAAKAITVENGTITVVFKPQTTKMQVKVEVR